MELTDLVPTVLALAGAGEPAPNGHSLLPLLTGEGDLERPAIYWHYPHYGNQGGTPGSSVRAGDWKLIEFFEDGRLELYNLREDVSEERNLADERPELTARLAGMLGAWRESVEAKIPQPNPGYVPWQ